MKKILFVCTMLVAMCMVASAQNCWQYSMTAPGIVNGDNQSAEHCGLMPGFDAIVKVTIPAAGNWTFTTCSGGGEQPFNTHIFIGTECCTNNICESEAGTSGDCGGTLAECVCQTLDAGVYYVTIEGDFENQGTFSLQVVRCSDECFDLTMTAPGQINGNTCNYNANCDLMPGNDVVVKVVIPTDGFWDFSTCGSGGSHSSFLPYLYIGTTCCSEDICSSSSSDYCVGGDQWAACPCVWLKAGVYYVTLDAPAGFCDGFQLQVTASAGAVYTTVETQVGEHFCLTLGPCHSNVVTWCSHVSGTPIVNWQSGCNLGVVGCNVNCEPYQGQLIWSDLQLVNTASGCWQYSMRVSGIPGSPDNRSGCVCVWLDENLPVELTSFTAIGGDQQIELAWSTASETNNQGFNIYRAQGEDWQMIGQVAGHGTVSATSTYTYTDNSVLNGTTYRYRLASVDFDGATAWRGEIVNATPSYSSAQVNQYSLRQNYPNPFNPSTEIVFDMKDAGMVSLKVYNLLGQEVAALVNGNMSQGRHTVSFNAAGLPSGMYLYKMEANGFSAQNKMLLMK